MNGCPWRLRAGTIDVDCQDETGGRHEHWHRHPDGWGVEWGDPTDGAYRYPLADADRELYANLVAVLRQLPVILRATRIQRGLSGREAAEKIGVAPSTVSRVENGKGEASLAATIEILRWIGDLP